MSDIYQLEGSEPKRRGRPVYRTKTVDAEEFEKTDDFEAFIALYAPDEPKVFVNWREECNALKAWRELEIKRGKTVHEIIQEEAKRRSSTTRTVWRIYEIIRAIEEFPILEQESSGSQVLVKYKQLKELDKGQQKEIRFTDNVSVPLKCLRCLHQWIRRQEKLPVACPRCHSPYWNKERIKNDRPKKQENN